MSRPGPSERPPIATVEPVEPPPDDARPTAAQLAADIDSGRTGDKNPVRDPALAPLGTDDEAAGRAPEPFRVALARRSERFGRWLSGARPAGAAHGQQDGPPVLFLAVTAAISVTLLAGIWLVRAAP